MKTKWTVLLIAAGFVLACFLGFSYNHTQQAKKLQLAEEADAIEAILGIPVHYKETDQSVNCNVYSTDSYEIQVDAASGKVQKIAILPDADFENKNSLISPGTDMESLRSGAIDFFQGFVKETDLANLNIEESFDEELGYSFTVREVDGEYETGNKALVEYDPDGVLIAAVFMNDEGTDYSMLAVSLEDALETAIEEAETVTLTGAIEGSKTAEEFRYKSESHEIRRWNGATYYRFTIYADVTFSDRGVIEKMYTVRVDANTGLVYDYAWSLN